MDWGCTWRLAGNMEFWSRNKLYVRITNGRSYVLYPHFALYRFNFLGNRFKSRKRRQTKMKRTEAGFTLFLCVLTLFLLLQLGGCSGKTTYSLEYDGLSIIPEDFRIKTIELQASTDKYLFLLPVAELLEQALPLDTTLQHGLALSFPVPAVPEGGDLQMEMEATLGVLNQSTSSLPSVEIELFLAGIESANIYEDGISVMTFSTGEIAAGESGTIRASSVISEGDPGWLLLTEGEIRCGIMVHFKAAASTDIILTYSINRLRLRVSVYPFGYIP
jgi:hypothetical protein